MSTLEKYGITKSDEKNTSGVSKKVMGFVDGEKVMIKSDSWSKEMLAEYFAYKLGEKLSLPINKVKLVDCGELLGLHDLCSVHWWRDDFERASRSKKWATDEELAMIKFFDGIIGNEDRHDGNWGFTDDGFFLIDHGLSYPWNSFDSDDIRKIHNSWKKVPHLVEKFMSLTKDDFLGMLKLPDDLEHPFGDEKYFNDIVDRMFEARMIIEEAKHNEQGAA
jgi:hypothetical protein